MVYGMLDKTQLPACSIGGEKGGAIELQPHLILRVLHSILRLCLKQTVAIYGKIKLPHTQIPFAVAHSVFSIIFCPQVIIQLQNNLLIS